MSAVLLLCASGFYCRSEYTLILLEFYYYYYYYYYHCYNHRHELYNASLRIAAHRCAAFVVIHCVSQYITYTRPIDAGGDADNDADDSSATAGSILSPQCIFTLEFSYVAARGESDDAG